MVKQEDEEDFREGAKARSDWNSLRLRAFSEKSLPDWACGPVPE